MTSASNSTTSEAGSRASLYAPLPAERAERWRQFGNWEQRYFPQVVGLELEEARTDYSRMRLPYRSELQQPAGVVHGGAIATLIDTAVVPAIASAYDEQPILLTIDMQIRYLGPAREEDLLAEAWVVKRGKSIVFCQVEVTTSSNGNVAAEGWLTYRVIPSNGANRP